LKRRCHKEHLRPECALVSRRACPSSIFSPTSPPSNRSRSKGNLVPVMAELAADYETPLSAFQKIHDGRCAFLLESAELTQHSGRYSLLGSSPRIIFTARGREIEIEERGKKRSFTTTGDPL
jgi:hypothetical protein